MVPYSQSPITFREFCLRWDKLKFTAPISNKQYASECFIIYNHLWLLNTILYVDNKVLADKFNETIWEVELSEEAEKALSDRSISKQIRERAIKEILHIASGEPRLRHSQRKLDTPKGFRRKLYEANLGKAERMIWEETISFSSRLNSGLLNAEKKYVDVIRVWDIVTNHDRIWNSVKRIERVYKNCEQCTVPRNLRPEPTTKPSPAMIILPKTYTTIDREDNTMNVERFTPLAVPDKGQYSVIKFKEFSHEFARHVIDNSEIEVEFPFKVFEKEYDIVNQSNDNPILLQGRSGTGKTTSCLYRMWKQFVGYWDSVTLSASGMLSTLRWYPLHF